MTKKNALDKAVPQEQSKCMTDYLQVHSAIVQALSDADNARDLGTAKDNRGVADELYMDQEIVDTTILGLRETLNKLYSKITMLISPCNTPAENIEGKKITTKHYRASSAAFHVSPFYSKQSNTKVLNASMKVSSSTSLAGPRLNDKTMLTKYTETALRKSFDQGEDTPSNKKNATTTPFIYDEYVESEVLDLPYLGPIKLSDESVYKGQMLHGKPWGKGKQVWKDGKAFEGYYKNGIIEGKGRMVHPDQDIYEGQWKNSVAHGKGKYKRADGWVYEGDWVNDQPHGNGVEIMADNTKYEGSYNNGLKEGKGVLKCVDGSTYKGEFQHNLFHGEGTYIWPDGRKYEGSWVQNLRHGKGVMTWSDGRKYAGEFQADKRDGYGAYEWGDGRKYVGHWMDGKPQGQGRLQNPNGEVLEGDWKDGNLGPNGYYAAISVKDLKTLKDIGYADVVLNRSDMSDSKMSIDKTIRGSETQGIGTTYSIKSVMLEGLGGDKRRYMKGRASVRPEMKIAIKTFDKTKSYTAGMEKGKNSSKNGDGYLPVGYPEEREKYGGYKIQIHNKGAF